jgi:hypothetical protein
MRTTLLRRLLNRLVLVAIVCTATEAWAQGPVGAGSLTRLLAQTEPEQGVIRWGPLRLAPGLTITQLGTDFNVFDEKEDPKKDFVVAGTPDVSAFVRTRFFTISAYVGAEMQFYQKYKKERSIGPANKARVDILMSRFTPYVGFAQTRNRTRPNGEIDVRANIEMDELSAGLAYDLSTYAKLFAGFSEESVEFKDALEENVDLGQALSRWGRDYMLGFRTNITPLLGFELKGSLRNDYFRFEPTRNGEKRSVSATFVFDTAAVVSGEAGASYTDYEAVDPLIKPFRGVTGQVALTFSFLETARVSIGANRMLDYSFDIEEGYYVTNSVFLSYTHRLFSDVDVQVQGNRGFYDYGQRVGSTPRQDRSDTVNGNLGYNLKNRTRVAVNYELTERRSPAIPERNYLRRRVYISWLVAF